MRLDGEAAARSGSRPLASEPAAQQRVERRLERSALSMRIFLQPYGQVGVQRHGRSHLDIMMLAMPAVKMRANRRRGDPQIRIGQHSFPNGKLHLALLGG